MGQSIVFPHRKAQPIRELRIISKGEPVALLTLHHTSAASCPRRKESYAVSLSIIIALSWLIFDSFLAMRIAMQCQGNPLASFMFYVLRFPGSAGRCAMRHIFATGSVGESSSRKGPRLRVYRVYLLKSNTSTAALILESSVWRTIPSGAWPNLSNIDTTEVVEDKNLQMMVLLEGMLGKLIR